MGGLAQRGLRAGRMGMMGGGGWSGKSNASPVNKISFQE